MNGNYPRVFSRHDLLLHSLISYFCKEMVFKVDNNKTSKRQVTVSWCHLMATLVGMTFPVEVIDGYWCKSFEHSWVKTANGHIIDVSPVMCRAVPIMYPGIEIKDKKWNWNSLFVKAKKTQRERFLEIRKSRKFIRALTDASKKSTLLRKRYTKLYYELCQKNKIKPLLLKAVFVLNHLFDFTYFSDRVRKNSSLKNIIMSNKKPQKTSTAVIAGNGPKATELAVRIVGATLNSDSKTLLRFIAEVKEKNDKVTFCALSGIIYILATTEKRFSDVLDLDFGNSWDKELAVLFQDFKKILEKNEFEKYPIASLPGENVNKDEFWLTVWVGIFGKVFKEVFDESSYYKENQYQRTRFIHEIFAFVIGYKLADRTEFFNQVEKVTCEILDDRSTTYFSNSINKIWDSKRAAFEYFLRKIILFNPTVPQKTVRIIENRWRAWFLLEDLYKREQKKVSKKKLPEELSRILKTF